MKEFTETDLEKLYKPESDSSKGDNGTVTIIGGSCLFHGAPLMALKIASRIVDLTLFSSPEPAVGEVAAQLKSKLFSFIWVPWEEIEDYIKKSGAILIGPGLLRYRSEKQKKECEEKGQCGVEGAVTKKISEYLLEKYKEKQWVIDAGSLQTMEPRFIPPKAILTPNHKEFKLLFGDYDGEGGYEAKMKEMAKKYNCIIIGKGVESLIVSPTEEALVKGGNAGLTKGGTGDILAGLTTALASKNDPFLAACTASFVVKKAADELYEKVGFAYNGEDLAEKIPEVLGRYYRKDSENQDYLSASI